MECLAGMGKGGRKLSVYKQSTKVIEWDMVPTQSRESNGKEKEAIVSRY